MIKFQEGELLNLLPPAIKNDTGMVCLSYALKKAVDRLLIYERSAMTQNFLDSLPEKILDVLAVEFHSPYYLDDMETSLKREIIRSTLVWHAKAGTPGAVKELISTIFGEGEVEEWFEYGGSPGYFKINTNAMLTPEINAIFSNMIQNVKNVRSHFETIRIRRAVTQPICVGGHIANKTRQIIYTDGVRRDKECRSHLITQL